MECERVEPQAKQSIGGRLHQHGHDLFGVGLRFRQSRPEPGLASPEHLLQGFHRSGTAPMYG